MEYCISDSNPLNYSLSKRKFKNWDTFICDSSPGKRFNYMENGTALSERNTIVFGELRSDRTEWFQLLPGREVLIDSRYKICMNPVTAHEVHYTENPNIEFVDSDLCGSRLFVRFWQKGDRFKPLGMKHRRKLSDFFTDLKLSIRLKKEIPLICKKDRIIWIAGYRLDDRFKITEKTRNYYRLELKVLEQ